MIKMETAVRRGDINSVIELIAKFSHETHAKLPTHYRTVWSVEDLMAHGTSHAVTHVVKRFKFKKKKLQDHTTADKWFLTYLYVALENLYKDLLTEAYAEKRNIKVFSSDTELVTCHGHVRLMQDCMVRIFRYTNTEDDVVLRIDAEAAFYKVYAQSSAHLRRHLINWCIQPKITKYKLTGQQFKHALIEFQDNRFHEVLTAELIRVIQNDAVCRSRVCIAILGSAAHRKPGFHTVLRKGKPTLESQLLTDTVYH